MILGLKPMGKPTISKNTSFEQNQDFAWSSDSNLWGNQLLQKIQVLDRTKVLYGPQTQTYRETNYFKKYKFWTEPRSCMVLELKPMGKPTTSKKKVLDRTKVLHGPQTQTYGETNYFQKI